MCRQGNTAVPPRTWWHVADVTTTCFISMLDVAPTCCRGCTDMWKRSHECVTKVAPTYCQGCTNMLPGLHRRIIEVVPTCCRGRSDVLPMLLYVMPMCHRHDVEAAHESPQNLACQKVLQTWMVLSPVSSSCYELLLKER